MQLTNPKVLVQYFTHTNAKYVRSNFRILPHGVFTEYGLVTSNLLSGSHLQFLYRYEVFIDNSDHKHSKQRMWASTVGLVNKKASFFETT